jgi:hypothetical protein
MSTSEVEARQVSVSSGWQWIVQGFGLFRKSPVIWIALMFVYLLISMGLSLFKLVGPIILNLLAPVFVAGFMLGCRALDADEELELNHLFAGFKLQTAQLVTVGGIYLAGIIIVVGIMFAGSDSGMLGVLLSGKKLDEQQTAAALGENFMLTALLGSAVLIPLIMAYWFAPLLVAFHGLSAMEAMKQSFMACLQNILPFFVYSVISMALLLLAAIPFGLGLLIMIPTMTASLYASYKDIFAFNAVPAPVATEDSASTD